MVHQAKISSHMPARRHSALGVLTLGAVALLGACAMQPSPPPADIQTIAANPPPVAPGSGATWYHVEFQTNSIAIDGAGQAMIANATAFLQQHPQSTATIIGRTDTVGSKDYNIHLSHQRADAVRDMLVYRSNIAADRVETRWTGETRQNVPTGNDVARQANRVVDIAVH
jgi:OOP family OmpA-OmpF porin